MSTVLVLAWQGMMQAIGLYSLEHLEAVLHAVRAGSQIL